MGPRNMSNSRISTHAKTAEKVKQNTLKKYTVEHNRLVQPNF